MRKIYDAKYGNCYSFNYDGNRMVRRAGHLTGLSVRVMAAKDLYLSLTDSVGMIVVIHEPGIFPFVESTGFRSELPLILLGSADQMFQCSNLPEDVILHHIQASREDG